MMYRLSPHSTSDNDLAYRTKEEVEENWKKDGIARFKAYLIGCGIWDESKDADLQEQISLEIKDATEFADNAPYPKPEETLLHVYADDREEGEKAWQ
ncbi:2-oxoisovalerate dehydrogenase subunit alpha [Paenibacillus sp. P1XP2]|nr:2-oxoisovalerate dehydrogenase subunit alpha [Paenibacillus sp. P1XP2]